MSRVRHTMEVDEWIWQYAQRQTGQVNPAGFLRGLLGAAVQAETINQMRTAIKEETGRAPRRI